MSPETTAPLAERDPHARTALDIQKQLREARADFEQLVSDLNPTLAGFVVNQARRLGHRLARDAVTDILGEVWVIVWLNFTRREQGFRDDGRANFRGYACAIAKNCLSKFAAPPKPKADPLPSLPESDPRASDPGPRPSAVRGDFYWLLDTLHLLDAHLEDLPGLYPDPDGGRKPGPGGANPPGDDAGKGGERKLGPSGNRTYTRLLGLHESVRKMFKSKEFKYPGADDPTGADDE